MELHVRLFAVILVAETDGVVNPPLCMEPVKMASPDELMIVVYEPIMKLPSNVVSPDTAKVPTEQVPVKIGFAIFTVPVHPV